MTFGEEGRTGNNRGPRLKPPNGGVLRSPEPKSRSAWAPFILGLRSYWFASVLF